MLRAMPTTKDLPGPDEPDATVGFDGVSAAPAPPDVLDSPAHTGEAPSPDLADGTLYATPDWCFGIIGFECDAARPFEHIPLELLLGVSGAIRKETANR